MADTFRVQVQYPTVEFLGGSQTREVMAVGYVTQPSGIYVEVRIPKSVYSAEQVRDYGIGYAGTIEAIAALDGVDGMTWSQVQRRDGTLGDVMTVYVTSSSGNSAGSFVLPFAQLAPELAAPKVRHLRAQLDAAEAS